MLNPILKTIAFSLMDFTFASCLHAAPFDQEELLGAAAALTKVSAPVHTAVRYKNPAKTLADVSLLEFSTAHNPGLLERFKDYTLRARQEGKNSSVLVCDAQGSTALIEDAGCTSHLDRRIWETQPNHPCSYVLDLATTCPTH